MTFSLGGRGAEVDKKNRGWWNTETGHEEVTCPTGRVSGQNGWDSCGDVAIFHKCQLVLKPTRNCDHPLHSNPFLFFGF